MQRLYKKKERGKKAVRSQQKITSKAYDTRVVEWWDLTVGQVRGTASLNDEGAIENKVVPRCHHCKIFTHQRRMSKLCTMNQNSGASRETTSQKDVEGVIKNNQNSKSSRERTSQNKKEGVIQNKVQVSR
jgi:hypothetical protein